MKLHKFLSNGFVYSSVIVSLLAISLIPSEGSLENDVLSIENETKIDNDFVIKYSADGGFMGRHDFAWYNSTLNHLVSTQKINVSSNDFGTTDDLFDIQLSPIQQTNLTKIIRDGNFFNISFHNDQPDCCDIAYYKLRIKMGDSVNAVSWTSRNIWNEDLPLIVTQIVSTLRQYTADSSHLFSESRME